MPVGSHDTPSTQHALGARAVSHAYTSMTSKMSSMPNVANAITMTVSLNMILTMSTMIFMISPCVITLLLYSACVRYARECELSCVKLSLGTAAVHKTAAPGSCAAGATRALAQGASCLEPDYCRTCIVYKLAVRRSGGSSYYNDPRDRLEVDDTVRTTCDHVKP